MDDHNNDNQQEEQQQCTKDQDIMVKKLLDFINEDDDNIDQQQNCEKDLDMQEAKMKNDTNNNDVIISIIKNEQQQQQQVDNGEQTITNGNANLNDDEIINNNNNNNDDDDDKTSLPITMTSTTTASSPINPLDKITQRKSLDYLKELFNDRERLSMMPIGLFSHALRLLDQEIVRVRTSLIHIDGSADERQPLELPEPDGAIIQRKTRVSIPVEQYPEHNFVGRIIGPRGLTIQELEVDCGCKLYVRGKGSLRNKEKEEKLRGQPNWEHLNDDLHVMIVVEDSINRAEIKLNYARDQIQKLIDSVIMQKDDFKIRQLAELAILNDKFNAKKSSTKNRHPLMMNGLGHPNNHHLTLSSSSSLSSSTTTATTSIPNCLLIDTVSGSFGGTSQTSPQALAAIFNPANQFIGSTTSQYQQQQPSLPPPQQSTTSQLYPTTLTPFSLEQSLFTNQQLHFAQALAAQQQQQHHTNPLNTDLFNVMAGLHGYGANTGSDPHSLYNHYQRQSRYHPYHLNMKRKHTE